MRIKTPITLCILTLFLITYQHVLSNTMKYAFVSEYENIDQIEDDDEKAAANWFNVFFSANGSFVPVSSIKNNEVDLSQYKTIWLHIDREDNSNIPPVFLNEQVVDKFKEYYKQGGNLLLTTHATQYLINLGRTERAPNIVGVGQSTYNTDVWTINPVIGMVYDHSTHPIYSNGLSTDNSTYPYTTIPLIGPGQKEDHNCMWNLNSFGYDGNVVDAFERENNAKVIGTWGHVTDFCCAGIVEFLPTSEYKGNCIAIGVATYEWNQNDKTNEYLLNLRRLTSNALSYLATSNISTDTLDIESKLVAHFPMELNESKTSVREIISNQTFLVNDAKAIRENIPGAEGNTLRFDGYSTYIKGRFNASDLSTSAISASVWCAMESYPMMEINGADDAQTFIAGNMTPTSGFAFTINAHGRYGFEMFINGSKIICYAPDKFPTYEWAHLAAVVSVNNREIRLYKNNKLIATKGFTANNINPGTANLYIGKSYNDTDRWLGPFRLNTINGLIDDFRIYSGEHDFVQDMKTPENPADLSIPKIRFADDIQRPIFHAMPAANWTNEPHGLVFYNGKYHIFFQKNSNGPYWGRIHWGHLSSEDLISWKEEKMSIVPNTWYDFKGAWSGCVFSDSHLTNGVPHIYYTSVDLGKASIAEAIPTGDNLINWEKRTDNPIIPHKPSGLDEDFRDPYIFKHGENIYMVVGTRKNGKGATTLHRYDKNSKTWSNDGSLFYQATNSDYGAFWEMPVVVQMNDGKWMFIATPLGAKEGVETLYWVGTINHDGTFNPFSHIPKEIEVGNMSKDGFGLLSPSIMQKNGKNIAIGIVPDKLSGEDNYQLGWAHTYSLPREWSIDSSNTLIQKPYEGLKLLRSNAVSHDSINKRSLNGTQTISSVYGKAVEIEGIFTISSQQNQKFGFRVRKSDDDHAIEIFYEPNKNLFTVDARSINRLVNDGWLYNGLYSSPLPETLSVGQTCKIHVFMDHSIMDIFINDKWAFSIRIFPTDYHSNGVEVFSEGTTTLINSLNAWKYDPKSITNIRDTQDKKSKIYFSHNKLVYENLPKHCSLNVYDSLGRILASNVYPESFSGENLTKNNVYLIQINSDNFSQVKKVIKH
ncbi:MAG TPA: DUF4960 domain-containing protein [Paludibacter sp.]|nr:DUF4960 domain-containing protein [Paludibacter sp.]